MTTRTTPSNSAEPRRRAIKGRLWLIQRGKPEGLVLLVEGSFQPIAAAAYADPEITIFGMSGVDGWSHADLENREVVLIPDGDVEKKRDVWDAITALRAKADIEGALSVKVARLPVRGTARGLDDYLAEIGNEDRRRRVLAT